VASLQGRSGQIIGAPPSHVWQVLQDSGRLPDWVPVVERVTEHEEHEREGSVRRCEVAMGHRRGYMVERCLESIPERKLRHAVEEDSLGFTKMFRDYTFTLELEPGSADDTLVTIESFYEPRGLLARVMNALVMRRRFASVRNDMLAGLKMLAEGGPPRSPAMTSAPVAERASSK
jgi:uncharacterized protein YndB with AHSA1/START domain